MAKSNVMKPEWFKDKRVLDIGSFDGVLDIVISSKFAPKLLVGIDIDHHLTAKAMQSLHDSINNEKSMPVIAQIIVPRADYKDLKVEGVP